MSTDTDAGIIGTTTTTSFEVCGPDGCEIRVTEGTCLTWSVLAGIVFEGTGVVAALEPFAICIWVDPNEQLREYAVTFLAVPRDRPSHGLDGTGGFVLLTYQAFWNHVASGYIHVTGEYCTPESYCPKLEAWRKERQEWLRGHNFFGAHP